MRIALGADHGGYTLKQEMKEALVTEGHKAIDFGTHSPTPCDYPTYAFKVASAVSKKTVDVGILICKSGNGMAIVANKLPSVRAAICSDRAIAILSRQHNNANILVLGSEHLLDDPHLIVRSWLESSFEGGRHKRRVDQIGRLELKACDQINKNKSERRKKRKP